MSHAEEVASFTFYRPQKFTFATTHSRLDVALQVLRPICWSPECSNSQQLSVPELLPPASAFNLSHIMGNKDEGGERDHSYRRDRTEGSTIYVQTRIAVLDQVGMTVCIITTDRRPPYRGRSPRKTPNKPQ